jgi:hypothetical protein
VLKRVDELKLLSLTAEVRRFVAVMFALGLGMLSAMIQHKSSHRGPYDPQSGLLSRLEELGLKLSDLEKLLPLGECRGGCRQG